jgi:hypothetical protein
MSKSGKGQDIRYHRVDAVKRGASANANFHFSIAEDDSDSELVKKMLRAKSFLF